MLLTRRKQFILGCLFKDVIDDLHGIDCPGLNQSNCVFRLVVVDRDAKVPDFTLFLQLLNCVQPIPFRRADVALFEEVKERLLSVGAEGANRFRSRFRSTSLARSDLTFFRATPLTIGTSHELISESWRICAGLGRCSLTTIRNGDGPAVRPRRTGRTERLSASASSKLDKIPLITNFISNWAKAMPMQRRTPPPNGKYSKGE